ncbi:Mitochondrial import inner membrane translocase subunit Tim22 [Myotis brandtii]|uniref:Mitochondrial import inner membrane translocase subunit TIM22 n=1 Tax=Myotis brandtii TaxID=109478 RepID=S7PSX3_MYOBR|nr:Mitochondrial import inner membrane translocase subunit Tim22 [Myotis brandtii]
MASPAWVAVCLPELWRHTHDSGCPQCGRLRARGGRLREAPLQYSLLLQYLVGDQRQPRLLEHGSLGGIQCPTKTEEQQMIEKRWKAACAFKAALACVGGFVLGGAFGVFTAGIDINVGFDPKDPYCIPTAKEVKDMGQRGMSYAKNFAIVGAMLSCTECLTESYQGRSDWKNSVISGCITGGAIGFRAGLNAGVIAFSAAFDPGKDITSPGPELLCGGHFCTTPGPSLQTLKTFVSSQTVHVVRSRLATGRLQPRSSHTLCSWTPASLSPAD